MTAPSPQDPRPRDVAFWHCYADEEMLSHTEISDAVRAWADELHPAPLPETVTVYGFARMDLPSAAILSADALEHILETLDEEHGDPDGGGTTPTPAMRAAALTFAESIRAEYKSWPCERVTRVVVRVADHVPAEWMQPPTALDAAGEGAQ